MNSNLDKIELNENETALIGDLLRRIQAGQEAQNLARAVVSGIAMRAGKPDTNYTLSPDGKSLVERPTPKAQVEEG